MNIIKSLEWRYATKTFDPSKKLSEEDFNELLEALRLTASSFGLQPWKFIVVRNPEIRQQLREHAWGQSQVTDASHLIVLASKKEISDADIIKFIESTAQAQGIESAVLEGLKSVVTGARDRMTPEQVELWNANQIYIALGNLLTVAALKEIDACPMEGFNKEEFERILGSVVDGYKIRAICPVGYRSDEDHSALRAKMRYPKEDVVVEIN
ncbi:MAG: NAD(P)H-dependent oxidoreductase [Candidatus Gracilibacteria bacterium]